VTTGLDGSSARLRAAPGPWDFHGHAVTWAVMAVMVAVVVIGTRRLTRRVGGAARPSRRQVWYLAGAVLSLAAATTWPLGDLAAHWSLTALVVQRLLLTLAVAPLALLGTPSALWAALTRPPPVDAVVRAVTRPVVAVAVFSAVVLGTLVSPAVAAQSSTPGWRAVVDACLVAAGVVLWAPAMRHLPGVHRSGAVGVAVYLFVQSIVPTFLAIVYVFAHRPFYPSFHDVRRALSMSPLVDQQVAGVVGKVGTLPVLWSAAWASLARAQRAERAVGAGEPLTWADVERQLERAARDEARHAHPGALRARWDARRTPRHPDGVAARDDGPDPVPHAHRENPGAGEETGSGDS
jgi:cytochrome c oxidase assembly factor CtaG